MAGRKIDDFPHPVRAIENLFIPMSDGSRLAARVWLPEGAARRPAPAILEYIPYRKRDFMRFRDEPIHRYYAGHGYCSVRVDLRGSGDSDGILEDEYTPREQHDAVEVIEWLAAQPWCNGKVGMTGISWGGFNALQVAALAPDALGAIITLCASDDRYRDDAHYMGGCLLNENQIWGTVLFGLNALPPDPEVVGARWREMWLARLEANRPFPALWLRHPRRDAYWKQGSVCEDFSRIRCPVYAMGGWADGYTNAVPRLLEGLRVPRKGLIGPWAHTFPHNGVPGPAIGYLQEALRWWDHWLKGADTGIMNEPMLRVWMQESVAPEPFHAVRPGRWVAEERWPSPRLRRRVLHLTGAGALAEAPGPGARLQIRSPAATGLAGGDWCGFGGEGEAPLDQREDDAHSLVFDSQPLESPLEILGAPEADLEIASDLPLAMLAVRLNDVAPDGTSARVTFGLLNLAHREGHADPAPLVPHKPFRVAVALNHIAHSFPAGHLVRLAISTAYWPMTWPMPAPATIALNTGASTLSLPARQADPRDASLPDFADPEEARKTSSREVLRPGRFLRSIDRDPASGVITYRLLSEGGDLEDGAVERIEEIGLDLGHTVERRFSMTGDDPLSARSEISEQLMMRRGNWAARLRVSTDLTAGEHEFRLRARLAAREGDDLIFEREWDERIPRDLI